MVYANDSKSFGGNPVEVQVLSPAHRSDTINPRLSNRKQKSMKRDEKHVIDTYSAQTSVSTNLAENAANVEIEKILAILRQTDLSNRKILDLGCGTGQLTRVILNEFKDDFKLYALDIVKEDLEVLRNSTKDDRLILQEGSFYELPFEDNHFDIVVSNHVIHYAEDLARLINETSRILKEDGIFLFSTVCFQTEAGKSEKEVIYGTLTLPDSTALKVHAYARTFSEVETILKAHQFLPVYNLSYEYAQFFKPHNYHPNTSYDYNTVVTIFQKTKYPQNDDVDFARVLKKAAEQLQQAGLNIAFLDEEIVDADKHIPAKGYFLNKNIYIQNSLSDDLKLYVLLHSYGHIAQWHFDQGLISLSDKLNTIDVKDIEVEEHYEHEVDTLHYCFHLLSEIGEYTLAPWLIQYFNADMLYMSAYFKDAHLPNEKVFQKFFESVPKGDDTRPLYLKKSDLSSTIKYSDTPVYVL